MCSAGVLTVIREARASQAVKVAAIKVEPTLLPFLLFPSSCLFFLAAVPPCASAASAHCLPATFPSASRRLSSFVLSSLCLSFCMFPLLPSPSEEVPSSNCTFPCFFPACLPWLFFLAKFPCDPFPRRCPFCLSLSCLSMSVRQLLEASKPYNMLHLVTKKA